MRKGLILGKFFPFHKGHQALIEFGAERCRKLVVLICASDKEEEEIPADVRLDWLQHAFAGRRNIRIELFRYREDELPNTSESSEAVAAVWAEAIRKRVRRLSCVFSSEPYGDMLARHLKITHIMFDQPRQQVPVAASYIRQSPHIYWDYLPDFVRPWFLKKVVILGTESTGKSMVTELLASRFRTNFVPEVARDIVAHTQQVKYEDLQRIANEHAHAIRRAEKQARAVLFIDTDIHITRSYARYLFQRDLPVHEWVEAANKADLYLHLSADAQYVQDGTRLPRRERDALDGSHRRMLERSGISFVEIKSQGHVQMEEAIAVVRDFLDLSIALPARFS